MFIHQVRNNLLYGHKTSLYFIKSRYCKKTFSLLVGLDFCYTAINCAVWVGWFCGLHWKTMFSASILLWTLTVTIVNNLSFCCQSCRHTMAWPAVEIKSNLQTNNQNYFRKLFDLNLQLCIIVINPMDCIWKYNFHHFVEVIFCTMIYLSVLLLLNKELNIGFGQGFPG